MHRKIVCALMLLFALLGTITQSVPTSAARATLPAGFKRVLVAKNLNTPTDFAFQGKRIFVAERAGVVRIVARDGKVRAEPYVTLNVSTNIDRGLLGIAVDPKYSENKFVYVYYTTGPGALQYSGTPANRLSRFKTKKSVAGPEEILVDNIPSDGGVHDGGALWFGPDQKLYVGIGDGGIHHSDAGVLSNLRGKILRLDLDGSAPPDNPFVNTPGADPRIYAYGFRNPFRSAVRPSNQSVLIGDVGEVNWEEIDSLAAGADYGWNRYEGPCLLTETNCNQATVDFNGTVPPVHFYHHSTGAETGSAIIVGAFPQASNYPPPYNNAMFYGDWWHGWVHVLKLNKSNRVKARLDFDAVTRPVAFQTGPDGNIYVLTISPGKLFKYVYTAP